jgi:diadenosine tetraphosphate (Ap4A) HIT family hydrolase
MNNPKPCSFCQFISGAIDKTILFENETGFVVRDGFPITQGHTLIIPKQHIGSLFDISQSQRQDLFALVDLAKAELDQEYAPDSYNIGINDGEAAGQTIPHLHIHLIPLYVEKIVEDNLPSVEEAMDDLKQAWQVSLEAEEKFNKVMKGFL